MSQRKLIFNLNATKKNVILVGWDRPLSQLFMMVGSESLDVPSGDWMLDDKLIIDTYIDILPEDICTECLDFFGEFIKDGHREIEQSICSDEDLNQLLSLLKQDALESEKASHSMPLIFSVDGKRTFVHS